MLAAGGRHRRGDDLEVLGVAGIGQDVEKAAGIVELVALRRAPRRDQAGRPGGIVPVEDVHLRSLVVVAVDDDEPVRLGLADAEEIGRVAVLEDNHVLRRDRCRPCGGRPWPDGGWRRARHRGGYANPPPTPARPTCREYGRAGLLRSQDRECGSRNIPSPSRRWPRPGAGGRGYGRCRRDGNTPCLRRSALASRSTVSFRPSRSARTSIGCSAP